MSGNFIEGSENSLIIDYHPTIKDICENCSMQCEKGCSEFLNGAGN